MFSMKDVLKAVKGRTKASAGIHAWLSPVNWCPMTNKSACQGSDEISRASDRGIRVTVCRPGLALPSLVSSCSESPAVLLVMEVEVYGSGIETATPGLMSATNVFVCILPFSLPVSLLFFQKSFFLVKESCSCHCR